MNFHSSCSMWVLLNECGSFQSILGECLYLLHPHFIVSVSCSVLALTHSQYTLVFCHDLISVLGGLDYNSGE